MEPAIRRSSAPLRRDDVGRKTYCHDVYIPVNGKAKKRDKALAKAYGDAAHHRAQGVTKRFAEAARKSSSSARGKEGKVDLGEEAQRYLSQRAIHCEVLPTAEAVEAYNRSKERKAALIHVTC